MITLIYLNFCYIIREIYKYYILVQFMKKNSRFLKKDLGLKYFTLAVMIILIFSSTNFFFSSQLCENRNINIPSSSDNLEFICKIDGISGIPIELNNNTPSIIIDEVPGRESYFYLNISKNGVKITDDIEIYTNITNIAGNSEELIIHFDYNITSKYHIAIFNISDLENNIDIYKISFIFNSTFHEIDVEINTLLSINRGTLRIPVWVYFVIGLGIIAVTTSVILFVNRNKIKIHIALRKKKEEQRQLDEIEKEKLIEEHEKIINELDGNCS